MSVTVLGADLVCMHYKYPCPFCKVSLSQSNFVYTKLADHDIISGNLGVIELSDMTEHPNTIDPKSVSKCNLEDIQKCKLNKLASLKSPEGSPTFVMTLFTKSCPLRPTEIRNTMSDLKLQFDQVWGMYVDELTLKRVFDYIICQFIYSLTPKEE